MPTVKLSRKIDRVEYTIYGADAEMAYQVLNGDILNNLLGDTWSKEKIKDYVYKSLNDKEKISYIAASEISVAILRKALGIDVGSIYDKLKDFENTGKYYSAYREHVVHQWRVFVLGIYILETNPSIKIELQCKLGEKYIEAWSITALCHDIGYLMEWGDIGKAEFASEIVKLLNQLDTAKVGFSVFCPELDLHDSLLAEKENLIRSANIFPYNLQIWTHLFQDRDNNNEWILHECNSDLLNLQGYYNLTTQKETATEDRPHFVDHGIASAAILLYLVKRKKYWIEKLSNLQGYQNLQESVYLSPENWIQVYQAISLHNIRPNLWDNEKAFLAHGIKLNTFKINWKEKPLAFLLVLCDSLQEWNRPSRDIENKLRKEMTSQDMHVILKEKNIYLCFPTDELAKSFSPDSSYHRILQPINRLLNYEDCIAITEINENEVKKYLDETLWLGEYRRIDRGDSVETAYALYKEGREYGNATRWEDGKRLHIDAAKMFQGLDMNDWASRSLGRAAVDALDIGQMPQADKLMEEALEIDQWQGTANYYWILEHCIRKDESLEIIEKYFSQMLLGMQKLEMIDDAFEGDFRRRGEEEKFCILWDKLILLFTTLLQKEEDWPAWSKSDQARQYVLMAERNVHESQGYLDLAAAEYEKVSLASYAAWTKAKCLFLKSSSCKNVDQMTEHLKKILDEEKKILQTPGGPRDIVRFSIKVNSFYYNVLMYFLSRDEKYRSEARVYCSAIDTFRVSQKYEYKELCQRILEQIENGEINVEELLEAIMDSVTDLAWLERNKMKIVLR